MTAHSSFYDTYFDTPDWALIRSRRIAHARGRCEHVAGGARCEQKATTVHHLTYARLGHERLSDLIALCETHHAEADAARREAMLRRTVRRESWLERTWRAIFG